MRPRCRRSSASPINQPAHRNPARARRPEFNSPSASSHLNLHPRRAPLPTPTPGPAPDLPKPPFAYHPPGNLLEKDAGRGRANDRFVYLPDIVFPLKLGDGQFPHMNSQIWGYGGGGWGGKGAPGGSESDRRNYDPMQQRDNYCEVRGWAMPLCPSGAGHQGQDIRPATFKDNTWEAVAVTDGTITNVTKNTTVQLKGQRRHRLLLPPHAPQLDQSEDRANGKAGPSARQSFEVHERFAVHEPASAFSGAPNHQGWHKNGYGLRPCFHLARRRPSPRQRSRSGHWRRWHAPHRRELRDRRCTACTAARAATATVSRTHTGTRASAYPHANS